MKNIPTKILSLFISLTTVLFLTSAYATDNFVKIKLPKGVSIELPKNWVVLSKDQRITLDTMVESGLDLAGIDQENSDLPFAANYYKNGKTIGIINNRYYSDLELTQTDAQQATNQDVKELDAALKENVLKAMSIFGISTILSWEGTKKTTINGITVFVTEYHRKALKGTGEFRVRLVRVFAGKKSFTLTVSYSENEAFFLKTITDRVINSLKLTGIEKAQAENNVASLFHDIMSRKYGENWAQGIMSALLVFWGIGLTPPLIIRFLFVRKPIDKGWAIGTVVMFWFINLIFISFMFGFDPRGNLIPYFLIAWASYGILRKGYKKVSVENAKTDKNA